MMKEHDYVIIGAGPAGLQLGYFFARSGTDYVILEARDIAASFFRKYPIHRSLLSINKVNNYYEELDFNMRHDWNSLLSDRLSLRFRNYSESLYPDADDLVRYMNDFAREFQLNIAYNTKVQRIGRQGRFLIQTATGESYLARRLIMATGAVEPYIPEGIEGVEHAIPYSECDQDAEKYKNKRVAILGQGNSAFEVANHLAGHAAIVHLLVQSPVKHAWQTHFVGDLRAINNTILDMYQLKSLHGTVGFRPKKIATNADGSLKVTVEEDLPHWEVPGTTVTTVTYDAVIVCTGWRYIDLGLFEDSARPEVDASGKYPVLSSRWESSVKDLYFAGTVTAARDNRSASGFIHGFRYNTRSLYHLLRHRYHGDELPTQRFALNSEADLERMADFIIKRISTTDALYQQNAFLSDVIAFGENDAAYSTELPLDLVKSEDSPLNQDEYATVTLEYGFHNYPNSTPSLNFIHPSDQHDTACSAFLHPVFRYYRLGELAEEMHLGESLMVRYDQYDYEENIVGVHKNMVMNYLNRIRHCTDTRFDETKYPDGVFTVWPKERAMEMDYIQPCAQKRFAGMAQDSMEKKHPVSDLLSGQGAVALETE